MNGFRYCLWAFALSLCTPSPAQVAGDAGMRTLQAADARVATVAYRLATANLALCAKRTGWAGFTLHHMGQYDGAYRTAAQATFALDARYPAILALVPHSPAAQAGIRADETVSAIGELSLETPIPAKGRRSYTQVDEALRRVETALAAPETTVTLGIGPEARTVPLRPVAGCASRVEMLPGAGLNAGADGKIVQIDGALVEFTTDDDELAVIIAHEMAHNILEHRDRLDAQKVARGLFSMFGKNASRIRRTEEEADHFGLYLAARAGYDITRGAAFWRRYARRNFLSFLSAPTHPSIGQRIAKVEEITAEIDAKRAAGLPLLPDGFPSYPVP